MIVINAKVKEAAEWVVQEHRRIVRHSKSKDFPRGNPSSGDWEDLSDRIGELGEALEKGGEK